MPLSLTMRRHATHAPFKHYNKGKYISPQRVTRKDSAPKRMSPIKVGEQLGFTLYHQRYIVLLVRISHNPKPENRVPVSTVTIYPCYSVGDLTLQASGSLGIVERGSQLFL